MAITATERAEILQLVVLMFDAAPGATYLNMIVNAYEANGHNLFALAESLGSTAAFESLHPNFQTAEEFAADMLSTVGLEDDATAMSYVEGLFNSGMPKWQIMYTAWDILADLPDSYGPQYQEAQEILLNKAEVSEYYSVTLGGSATDVATLQDVIQDVDATQESVDAAEDAIDDALAVGPELTTGNDTINVLGDNATNIAGVVDFDNDGNPIGTFNPGDNITGNGNTNLQLVVVDAGTSPASYANAGFERLTDIEAVSIEAGTDGFVEFNAAAWNNVGMVTLNDGVDGLTVFLNNLQAGVDINVNNVTGTVSASYDTDSGNVYAWIHNDDEGGDGITLAAEANGDVTVVGADSVSAFLSNTTGVTLGDVTVTEGDNAWFSMYFSDSGFDVGDVTVTLGDGSGYSFTAESVDGDVTVGDQTVTVGDSSTIDISATDITGDVTFGDMTFVAGATADVEITISDIWTGDVTVGDVMITAGDSASVDLSNYNIGDNVTYGDITVSVGASSSVEASFDGYGTGTGGNGDVVTAGDVNITMGGNSYANLAVWSYSSANFGDINITVGDASTSDDSVTGSSTIDVSFSYISNDVTIGNVNLQGGLASDVTMGVFEIGTSNLGNGSVTIGDVAAAGGQVQVWVTNSGTGSGDVTVGDVTLTATTSYAWLTLGDHSQATVGDITATAAGDVDVYIEGEGIASSTTVSGTVTTTYPGVVPNITVGNVSLESTGDSTTVSFSADLYSQPNAGNITIGDITEVAGDNGNAYAYAWVYSTATTSASNTGTAAGNITVGDVSLTVGDVLSLSDSATASVSFSLYASSGAAGDVTVGDVSVTVGDGFASGTQTQEAFGYININNSGPAVGDLTVGDITMTGGDFASLTMSISGYAWTTTASAGTFTVGDQTINAGESAYAHIYDYWANTGDGVQTIGDMTVGDVTVNVAQDSLVSISITYTQYSDSGTETSSMGSLTVGDIDVVAGDNSTVDLAISQYASFSSETDTTIGDTTIGDINIAVSATTDVDLSGGSIIDVNITKSTWENDAAAGANLTIGDISLSAGDTASVSLDVNFEGSHDQMGDLTVGVISLMAGDDAVKLDATIYVSNDTTGDMGNVTLGGIDLEAGDGTVGNVSVSIEKNSYAGNIGDLDVGDLTIVGGDTSTLSITLNVNGSYTDLGTLSAGDISVDLGAGSVAGVYLTWTGTGDIGASDIGDITVSVGDGSVATLTIDVSSTAGDVGDMVVGDIDLGVADLGVTVTTPTTSGTVTSDVGGTISLNITNMSSDTNADLTVGDITVNVAGTASSDEVHISLSAAGDVTIGDVIVSGSGLFILDGATHATMANMSYLGVSAGATNTITIGDIDFSGYQNDISLDLSWTDAGAANIAAGAGDDTVYGNTAANIISGGDGMDLIDISQGGKDTVVTSEGESGTTGATIDQITGFNTGTIVSGALSGTNADKLDFNFVAGTAGNFVVETTNAADLADFISHANDALNSTVKYFAMDDGANTWVAVNFGSGEADMIIQLTGVSDASTLHFQNIIA